MRNIYAINHFLVENSWKCRFWIESELEKSDEGNLNLLLLKEVAHIRDSGHPKLSLDLIELARSNGFDNPWLLDNQARAYIRLSENTKGYRIWCDLVLFANDVSLRQSCLRALINFKAYDYLAQIDQKLKASSTNGFDSTLAVVSDLIEKKDFQSTYAVLDSLTKQSCFHPMVSYYRALADHAAGNASECLMICDALLSGDLADDRLTIKVQELANTIRSDTSIYCNIEKYHSDLNASFVRFGWRAVYVNGQEDNIPLLNKSVVKEAIAARDSGLVQMSLTILNLALLYEPNNPWVLENKARALCLLADFGEAMEVCRIILNLHPKHRAANSALSMLERYDRNYKLSAIYAEVQKLIPLGNLKREEALFKMQESFAIGFTPEGGRLMNLLMQANKPHDSNHRESQPRISLEVFQADLQSAVQINRGLAAPVQPLSSLRSD